MARSERMSTFDAAWLQMDSPENPMVITGVLWLDRPLRYADLSDLLSQRLIGPYPRFRQRVVYGVLGEPRWAVDPKFDLRLHLHHIGLPAPGGQPALQNLVSQLLSSPLEMSRSPWQIHLVDGYLGGSAIIARLHHALADGISLARVLLSLADEVDDVTLDAEPGSTEEPSSMRSVLRDPASAGEKLLDLGRSLRNEPDRVFDVARQGGTTAAVVGRLLTMSDDPPTPLKGELGPLKRAVWSSGAPLAEIKSLARRLHGTVNDVLLYALACALGRYLRQRGTPQREVRTLVPVNLRPADKPVSRDLGNHFGMVFVPLPVDHLPPKQRFDEVRRRMKALKDSTEPALTYALLNAVGRTPLQFEKLFTDSFGAKASLITTNVPGPTAPLHLAGAELRGVLFWVPQSAGVSLGVSLFSYAGTVWWGVSADAGRIPDPEALVEGMSDALDQLRSSLNDGSC
ncbi:MAG: wax ester/triacylglycerol synthase family O-acyltransferase [Deltaproteobacteria bacterium]|nr:MAG: wax ester/triacylglycerol synthase family O-acyltransferase [Deltaproteobacteria bacterium]